VPVGFAGRAGGVRLEGARVPTVVRAGSLVPAPACTGADAVACGAAADANESGTTGATLPALAEGGNAAMSEEVAAVFVGGVARDLKCDQANNAPAINSVAPPSNAKSARAEFRFRSGASSWVAERPTTDWLGTVTPEPISGPEMADTAPDISARLIGPPSLEYAPPKLALPSQMRLSSSAASRAELKR
jgi:hypothetical protein